MKKHLLPIMLFALALGASSCQKCATCECGLVDLNFCVDEFDTKGDYDDAVQAAENNGCDFTQKLEGK